MGFWQASAMEGERGKGTEGVCKGTDGGMDMISKFRSKDIPWVISSQKVSDPWFEPPNGDRDWIGVAGLKEIQKAGNSHQRKGGLTWTGEVVVIHNDKT